MDLSLKLSSGIKAGLVLLGLALGSGLISEEQLVRLGSALPVLAMVILEIVENYRLKKQGVVSLNPVVNAAEEMTPAKLAAAEKKEAKLLAEAKLVAETALAAKEKKTAK